MRRPPALIEVWREIPYEIGWYKAGSGRRLAAAPILEWNPEHVESSFTSGTVLRTERVGLTPEFLQQLKARIPDVDISYIAVDGWSWKDEADGGGIGDLWLWLALTPGIPGFGLFVLVVVLRRREHGLRQRFLQRLAGIHRTS